MEWLYCKTFNVFLGLSTKVDTLKNSFESSNSELDNIESCDYLDCICI